MAIIRENNIGLGMFQLRIYMTKIDPTMTGYSN